MDYRFRKLKAGDSSSSLMSRSLPTSRSFPTSMKHGCLSQCLNSSTDSLSSIASRSPKLGQYRKLPNVTDCDVCHKLVRDVTALKCSHSACGKCMTIQKIEKNGCPACCSDSSDSRCSSSNDRTPDDFQNVFADDAIFDNFEFEKYGEGGNKSTESLLKYIETKVLNDLRSSLSSLRDAQTDICTESIEQIDKIQDHVKELKVLIDKKADQLIRNIQESKSRHLADLVQQEKDLQQFYENATETVSEMQTIENRQKCDCYEKLMRLIKLTEQIGEESVHIRYTVKPLTDSVINNIVGKVGVRVFLRNKLSANTIRTLVFPGAIQAICPISMLQAWVAYQNFVQLCSKSGDRSAPVDAGDDVQDVCLDGNTNVLIACESKVKRLDTNTSSLSTVFTCSEPVHGITCHEDGRIITCLRNSIHVYSKDGVRLSEFSSDGLYDIKMPYKVARNANNEVMVSDFQSRFGDVVIFDSDGKPITKIQTDGMTPRGVACSRQGFIYVCDFRADRINVYSTHGHFLQTIANSSCGLSGPLSVAVGPGGDLWVGDWRRKVRVFVQTTERPNRTNFYM